MSEREQFEAWWRDFHTTGFVSQQQYAWLVWQAARAQPAQAGQLDHDCDCGRKWKYTPYGWASTEPAQAGQVLTDGFIKAEALEAFDCYWDADDETLVNKYGHGVYLSRFIDFARAIEQAVLAKRVPMTDEQVAAAFVREPIAMSRHDFTQGIRYAEVWHGIVGEKGGA